MLSKTIYLPTFNQTVHFSDSMLQVLLVNMTHIMTHIMSHIICIIYITFMNFVERNIDKHFLRNFAVRSTRSMLDRLRVYHWRIDRMTDRKSDIYPTEYKI